MRSFDQCRSLPTGGAVPLGYSNYADSYQNAESPSRLLFGGADTWYNDSLPAAERKSAICGGCGNRQGLKFFHANP
jgi:hypothetical protein